MTSTPLFSPFQELWAAWQTTFGLELMDFQLKDQTASI